MFAVSGQQADTFAALHPGVQVTIIVCMSAVCIACAYFYHAHNGFHGWYRSYVIDERRLTRYLLGTVPKGVGSVCAVNEGRTRTDLAAHPAPNRGVCHSTTTARQTLSDYVFRRLAEMPSGTGPRERNRRHWVKALLPHGWRGC